MRGTPYLQGYKDGVLIILKDRKIFVRKNINKKDPNALPGYVITSKRIIKGRYWKPVSVKRNKHNVVKVKIAYSREAMSAIFQAIHHLETEPEYNKTNENEISVNSKQR